TPNLIPFNANLVVKSTSYLAQKMFGANLGNIVLNSTATNSTMNHESVQEGGEGDEKLDNLYFIATKHTDSNTLIIKLASVDVNDTLVNIQIQDSITTSEGIMYILTGGPGVDPSTLSNTIDNPNAVSIITKLIWAVAGKFSIIIPSWRVVVVNLPL
ncbi:unnamed protein product, partial [Adineta ricciae]